MESRSDIKQSNLNKFLKLFKNTKDTSIVKELDINLKTDGPNALYFRKLDSLRLRNPNLKNQLEKLNKKTIEILVSTLRVKSQELYNQMNFESADSTKISHKKITDFYNDLLNFIALDILSRKTFKESAMAAERWIDVLSISFKENNFLGAMAIHPSLNNSAVGHLFKDKVGNNDFRNNILLSPSALKKINKINATCDDFHLLAKTIKEKGQEKNFLPYIALITQELQRYKDAIDGTMRNITHSNDKISKYQDKIESLSLSDQQQIDDLTKEINEFKKELELQNKQLTELKSDQVNYLKKLALLNNTSLLEKNKTLIPWDELKEDNKKLLSIIENKTNTLIDYHTDEEAVKTQIEDILFETSVALKSKRNDKNYPSDTLTRRHSAIFVESSLKNKSGSKDIIDAKDAETIPHSLNLFPSKKAEKKSKQLLIHSSSFEGSSDLVKKSP